MVQETVDRWRRNAGFKKQIVPAIDNIASVPKNAQHRSRGSKLNKLHANPPNSRIKLLDAITADTRCGIGIESTGK